ncbi:MAG TPA: EscE/YscE/SsaE family type III secretion system needle protein co-chaperone [Buttiauxella sp.]|jgi:type III secretion system YseE family protein
MPSVTLLEQVLRRPDGHRHALALTRILRRRRERLLRDCAQPMTQKNWQSSQQLAVACDAALGCIAILYRRYHNQTLEEEKIHEPF